MQFVGSDEEICLIGIIGKRWITIKINLTYTLDIKSVCVCVHNI